MGVGMVGLFVQGIESYLKSLMVFLFWICNIAILLLWIYVFIVRYIHSGQECSGDFIVSKKEAKYLLYVEGMFIKFCSLLVLFIALLICVGHTLNFIQRKTGGSTAEIALEL